MQGACSYIGKSRCYLIRPKVQCFRDIKYLFTNQFPSSLSCVPVQNFSKSTAVENAAYVQFNQCSGRKPFSLKLHRVMSTSMRSIQSGNSGATAGKKHHVNRLIKEESPYLLQHAHNPVDWYPWGQEAFDKAKADDKPIFLSVGYSTCHWCHVMEVESFENDDVAKILNASFVSIKVDREERPDVDKVYMTYVQATQGGGGWPMSVFLTPELQPVLGGTYFPPEDKYGRIGFKSLLHRVKAVWENRKDDLREGGRDAIRQLAAACEAKADSSTLAEGIADKAIRTCAQQLGSRYDAKLGGFGSPPKFPRPAEINLMLHQFLREQQSAGGASGALQKDSQRALDMAVFTLRCMARGGMHDHIGGGFHRYSVDEFWHVPHFEKMLYDQGQLALSYLDAFTATRDVQLALTARDILDYIRRDLTHREGGFFSAEDADSAEKEGSMSKKEGLFYVWTSKQIEENLGSDRAKVFGGHYFVKAGGNCELSPLSDPHHEFAGKNVLVERQGVEESAKKVGVDAVDLATLLGDCRHQLHKARAARPRPHLDDKIIVAWNGLAISAFARASRILCSEPAGIAYHFPVEGCDPAEYLEAASRAATFIQEHLYDSSTNQLKRSFREGPSKAAGFVDDYAFLITGLLDLYEAGGHTPWLTWALNLQAAQDELFLDRKGGAYYSTPPGDPSILLRLKEDYDGAEPSGNSYAASNLLRLSQMLTGSAAEHLRSTAEHTMAVFTDRLVKMPLALPQMCCSLDLLSSPAKRQVIIAGTKGTADMEALVNAAFVPYEPHRTVIQVDESVEEDRAFWQRHNPGILDMARKSPDGKAVAYICQNFTCQAPTSDAATVVRLLKEPFGAAKGPTVFFIGKSLLNKES